MGSFLISKGLSTQPESRDTDANEIYGDTFPGVFKAVSTRRLDLGSRNCFVKSAVFSSLPLKSWNHNTVARKLYPRFLLQANQLLLGPPQLPVQVDQAGTEEDQGDVDYVQADEAVSTDQSTTAAGVQVHDNSTFMTPQSITPNRLSSSRAQGPLNRPSEDFLNPQSKSSRRARLDFQGNVRTEQSPQIPPSELSPGPQDAQRDLTD